MTWCNIFLLTIMYGQWPMKQYVFGYFGTICYIWYFNMTSLLCLIVWGQYVTFDISTWRHYCIWLFWGNMSHLIFQHDVTTVFDCFGTIWYIWYFNMTSLLYLIVLGKYVKFDISTWRHYCISLFWDNMLHLIFQHDVTTLICTTFMEMMCIASYSHQLSHRKCNNCMRE